MTGGGDITCTDFSDSADELVLGHLGEPNRAALLAHAFGCDRCDGLLRDLGGVTDRLLLLAPQADPPPGFEVAAVARFAPASTRGRGSRSRRAALAFAGLASAALVVVALVALAGSGDPERRGVILSRVGEPVGVVALELASDSRVVITMPGPHEWRGTWICELLDPDRGWVPVGEWTADDVVEDRWAIALDGRYDDTTAMRILDGRGEVVAVATLRPAAG